MKTTTLLTLPAVQLAISFFALSVHGAPAPAPPYTDPGAGRRYWCSDSSIIIVEDRKCNGVTTPELYYVTQGDIEGGEIDGKVPNYGNSIDASDKAGLKRIGFTGFP